MRNSMLAKKFFINTGIDITMKTNIGSYSPTPLHSLLQISQFFERIEEISIPHIY